MGFKILFAKIIKGAPFPGVLPRRHLADDIFN